MKEIQWLILKHLLFGIIAYLQSITFLLLDNPIGGEATFRVAGENVGEAIRLDHEYQKGKTDA